MNAEKKDYYEFLFYQAVETQNLDLLKLIPIEYIPNTDEHKDNLRLYCKENNLLYVKYLSLTSKNNNVFNIILEYASLYGKLDIIKYAIESGANIHLKNDYPLILACDCGYSNIVKYLIENGADIHTCEEKALTLAYRNGNIETIQYLIKNGADISSI